MRTTLALLLALLASTASAAIRTHHELIPEFGATATRTTPDPASADESFRIEPGQTVTITGVESCKDIYVNGFSDRPAILELSAGCELRCQTILLAGPQAVLRTPPGQAISCKVVWRDLPLDAANDPTQMGNGLVCVSGEVNIRGENPRQAKAEVAAEIMAGHTTITLRGPPVNWQPGDEIWIPDTRQPSPTQNDRRVEVVRVASVHGSTVTLAGPVRFDHRGWLRQDQSVGELYEVANVTQSIVFESENPAGVRGHMIFMDHCLVDAEGYSLRHMGRTTTAPLSPGLNQPGRYPDHDHGNPGRVGLTSPWQSRRAAYSIVGSPKWGRVLHHATFFCLDENFAIVDCAGGHVVTETPNVSANAFRNGVIIGLTVGSGERITDRAHRNLAGGDHWHDRVGLGLQSVMNEFTDISIYDCKEGIGLAGFGTSQLFRPLVRGQHLSLRDKGAENLRNPRREYPLLYPLSGCRVWGGWRGVETWTCDSYPDSIYPHGFFDGLELINCRQPTDFEDQEETYLEDWRILGDFWQVGLSSSDDPPDTYGITFKDAYRFGVTMSGGEVRGYDAAYKLVHDREYTTFTGVEFECPVIMYETLGHIAHADCSVTFTDCEFAEFGDTLTPIDGWNKYRLEGWYGNTNGAPNRPTLNRMQIHMRPWLNGRDVDLYHPEQHRDFALDAITAPQSYGDWPAGVWSQRQLIDLGTPIYGEEIPAAAVPIGRFLANDVTLENRLQRLERELQEVRERLLILEGQQ